MVLTPEVNYIACISCLLVDYSLGGFSSLLKVARHVKYFVIINIVLVGLAVGIGD
jgi:hypothetical protein